MMRRPRARSLPDPPPAPAVLEPLSVQVILDKLARLRVDGYIFVWWSTFDVAEEQDDDDFVVAVEGRARATHLWTGQLVAVPNAPTEILIEEEVTIVNPLLVFWPGGLPGGPATSGNFTFPSVDLFGRSRRGEIVGLRVQRACVPPMLRATAVQLPSQAPPNLQTTATAVQHHPYPSQQSTSHLSPHNRRLPTYSRWLVPLIACAQNKQPSSTDTATEWQNIRNTVGPNIFDAAASALAAYHADSDDDRDWLALWEGDYLSGPLQEEYTLVTAAPFDVFVRRVTELNAMSPPFWASHNPNSLTSAPPVLNAALSGPLSGEAAILERLADVFENRGSKNTTKTICLGLKIPTTVKSPYTALYPFLWNRTQRCEWAAAHAALLSLCVGFRANALRKRYENARDTVMELWLNLHPLTLQTPKEILGTVIYHTSELVASLVTAAAGEERGRQAAAAVDKQFHDGVLDLELVLQQKTESADDKDSKKRDADELDKLKKQVESLQKQTSAEKTQQQHQQPIVIEVGGRGGRGRGGSFWSNRGGGSGGSFRSRGRSRSRGSW